MSVIQLLLGPTLLLLVIISKCFPPEKINQLYGYRTRRSMQSQRAWKAANRYAFTLLLWVSLVVCVSQFVFYMLLSEANAILFTSALMVTLLILIIPMTEKYLKAHFDDDGNQITDKKKTKQVDP